MPTYPDITPLPPAPDPDSPATFNALAYPFTAALQVMVDEFNDFISEFEILISDAQHAALQLTGSNGQLRIPTLTGSSTAASTDLSPAMRAALGLAGVAAAKRIAVLTGETTAELRGAGDFGLDLLYSVARADAIWQLKAVSYNSQGLTTAERNQAQINIGGSDVGRAVFSGSAETGRQSLGVPYTPQTWNWRTLSVGANTNLYLPADGQWAYIVFQYATSSGEMNATNFGASVAAGGSLVKSGAPGIGFTAMAWRVV